MAKNVSMKNKGQRGLSAVVPSWLNETEPNVLEPISNDPDPLPLCSCGRVVTYQRGCTGCGLHPYDCSCFPEGYIHQRQI